MSVFFQHPNDDVEIIFFMVTDFSFFFSNEETLKICIFLNLLSIYSIYLFKLIKFYLSILSKMYFVLLVFCSAHKIEHPTIKPEFDLI